LTGTPHWPFKLCSAKHCSHTSLRTHGVSAFVLITFRQLTASELARFNKVYCSFTDDGNAKIAPLLRCAPELRCLLHRVHGSHGTH
jgi:hypothetical protein